MAEQQFVKANLDTTILWLGQFYGPGVATVPAECARANALEALDAPPPEPSPPPSTAKK